VLLWQISGAGQLPPLHPGRSQRPLVLQAYGAGHGLLVVQVRITHTPVVAHRSPPPQSTSVEQLRWQAPMPAPQSVPVGQSFDVPQPRQTPPGAETLQVD
jgi:hypothetical protein